MKIGARILKTGVAVGLALYISRFLGLEPIIFAGIAATVTVQPSLYRSWQNSLQQIQANVVGAIVGVVLAVLLGTEPYVIALGVIVATSLNIQLKFNKSIPLAMVTVLAIMSSPSDNFWEIATDRFLLIFIGVASSILINIFIPPHYEKRLRKQLFDIQDNIALNLRFMVETDREIHHVRADLEQLAKRVSELKELYTLHREENRYKYHKVFPRTRKLVVFRSMVHTCEEGLDLLRLLEKHHDVLQADETARQLVGTELEKLASFQERVFLKYAGKLTPHLANHEDAAYDEPILPVEKGIAAFKDNETLFVHVLPVLFKIHDYREQVEELNRTVEQYFKFHNQTAT